MPDLTTESRLPLSIDDEQSVAQLAQVLAHRLRGLVAGIEGFTDLLTDTLIYPEQRELALKVMEGAARIESVLADLQLYAESLAPVMLPVRVDEVLRDLLAPLEDPDRSRIRLDVNEKEGGCMLLADPFLLRQALLILLQNALEATKDGGLISVEPKCSDGVVCLHVWNEGTIDIEDAEQAVFAPFFTTKANNLGVGLSIARRIARMHDGTLVLSSNCRVLGTRFSLCIPEPAVDDIR